VCGDEAAPGLHRIAWDLRPESAGGPQGCGGGQGRGGRGGGFGRGNQQQLVPHGRYSASIGTVSGGTFTAIGQPISFHVTEPAGK
jgi:hypothetical protein